MESEYILKTENLTKTYGKKKLVKDLNLMVKKGAVYGLIGKNGAGKTTTMKMITGLARPSSGEIEFSDEFQESKNWRSKISAVIENPAVYPYLSARQNLEVQRLVLRVKDKNVVNELLTLVGLADVGKKSAKKFSMGMKQRLAIAIALIGDPEFLLLDEPINGLDPIGVREIRDLIQSLNQRGVTIMISSHILSELLKIATHYGVINKGELVDQFSADELKKRLRSCVKIKVNDVQRAVTVISESLNLNDYRIDGNEIKFYTEENKSGEINTVLSKNDVIVESISSEGGDYEDYFIQLMEKSNDNSSTQEESSDESA